MKETPKRILTVAAMLIIAGGAITAQYFGYPAIQWLAVAVATAAAIELGINLYKRGRGKFGIIHYILATIYSLLFITSAYFVGARPWIMLLMLMIIAAADIGAWGFGRLFGGDKMWERLSAGKTWSGQIAGIICGTLAAILYGLLGADVFMPQLMWIGISVALMSQYGDLTASAIKRKLGIKDFGNILPGHGGILDRFDGWIYVLPLIWLAMV